MDDNKEAKPMNMKRTFAIALALAASAASAEFQAGFARVDATPPLGAPMPGYFSHRVRGSLRSGDTSAKRMP